MSFWKNIIGTVLNEFRIGDGADTDKKISAWNGDANPPFVQYDSATSKWQVSDDGTTTKDASSPVTTKGDLFTFDTVEERLGVGSNGDVLTAASGEDTGLIWAAPTTYPDVLTTKGDLHVFESDDARLPIGTDDFVLTADATADSGMKWAAAAGGDPLTTKGDLFGFDTDAQRLAVGSDGEDLVADSSAATGLAWAAGREKVIEVPVTATAGNFDSTAVLPDGAVVTKVLTNITTLYDGSATIAVTANGSSPVTIQTSAENDPAAVGLYEAAEYTKLTSTGEGVVRATLGGSPTVGVAVVYVHYVMPLT